MRIYLVRHGLSESNIDKTVHHKVADHGISLSAEGKEQATAAGRFLVKHFYDKGLIQRVQDLNLRLFDARLWVSPYKRTRQTADGIEYAFRKAWLAPKVPMDQPVPPGPWEKEPIFQHGRREHINLVEQQFGLFDGYEDEERAERYPKEFDHFKKCVDQEGEFWARMPLGESRFDVAVRVHQAFGTFKRDEEKHGIQNLIVVSHGTTLRAFTMQWLHLPFEWFEKEANYNNCSIRLIEDDVDRGFIFEGFPKKKT